MGNTDKITIEINKEIAKEAYEAGARWAFGDEDGILTIEGFETFWSKVESGLSKVETGENNALLPDVSVAKRTVCKINMTDCKHMGKNNRCELQAPGECSLQTER